VVATIATGAGTLSGTTTVLTDASGVATFSNLIITGTIGAYTLTFTPTGLTAVTSSSFTLTVGAATKGVLTTQPSGAASGVVLTGQPVVQLKDSGNNNVSTTGVNVVATISTGTGTLGGTATVATVAGVATFTDLKITGIAGSSYILTFTPAGLTAAVSTPAITLTGGATQGALTIQPSGAVNGVALTGAPVVQLKDAGSVNVSLAGVNVVATIATGAGTLSGTMTVLTDTSGVATFSNLIITGTIGSYTLTFTPTGLTAAVSSSFTLTVGAATKGVLTTQPSGAASGVVLTGTPVVQLRDSGNNNVTTAGVSVAVTISSGTGVLSGTTPVLTNASGVATFSDLAITGTPGSFTLTFTPAGLTPAVSNPFTLAS
jgi:hypothetical protein